MSFQSSLQFLSRISQLSGTHLLLFSRHFSSIVSIGFFSPLRNSFASFPVSSSSLFSHRNKLHTLDKFPNSPQVKQAFLNPQYSLVIPLIFHSPHAILSNVEFLEIQGIQQYNVSSKPSSRKTKLKEN